MPSLGEPLFCCHQWAQGSSPPTLQQLQEPLEYGGEFWRGSQAIPGSLSARSSVICVSPSCCWQLSSAGDFPRGLSPLLPLLSGTVVALARCHSSGNCVSTGPVCVNVTGVCGHEHTGTGGQSWNLDPRHHPFPALLPGAPGLQERAECLQGRAGVADLEQGTGGAPPRIHPWDIPGRAVSPRARPCRWPWLCPPWHRAAVGPALPCSGMSGVVLQRSTEVVLETGAGQSVLDAEVSRLAFERARD